MAKCKHTMIAQDITTVVVTIVMDGIAIVIVLDSIARIKVPLVL